MRKVTGKLTNFNFKVGQYWKSEEGLYNFEVIAVDDSWVHLRWERGEEEIYSINDTFGNIYYLDESCFIGEILKRYGE